MMLLCKNARELLRLAGSYLGAAEARHNLFYAGLEQPTGENGGSFVFESQAGVAGVALALKTEGGHGRLLVSLSHKTTPEAQTALKELASQLSATRFPLTQVLAPADTAAAFARLWAQRTGRLGQRHLALGLYELLPTTLKTDRKTAPGGRLRLAELSERELLIGWTRAFSREADHSAGAGSERTVDQALAEKRLVVWEAEGSARAMAAWSGLTPTGVRINMVYTPPRLRGRGFASSCVASHSQDWFARGKERVFLFTDLSNPASNRVYQKIGFGRVCDFAAYDF